MCNKELPVAWLYDDLNDMDRAKVEMHLRACEACREELAGLRDVRVDLAAWAPPLPDLGFRIVREVKPAAKLSWRSWWTPAAGLAAAATLVLPASLHDDAGLEELFEQSRQIIAMRERRRAKVFGAQLAFNLLPARPAIPSTAHAAHSVAPVTV